MRREEAKMAMNKLTKQDIANRRGQYEAQLKRINTEIAEHQESIDRLTAQKENITAIVAALKKDIPEPEPEILEV